MKKRAAQNGASARMVTAKLAEIEIHPAIPDALVQEVSAITHQINVGNLLTPTGITRFLMAHPIQCIALGEKRYLCVAGLRSLQVARCNLEGTDSVPVLLQSTDDCSPPSFALCDTYISSLLFGLDGLAWDVIISTLADQVGSVCADAIQEHSRRALAKRLGIDRRRLSKKASPTGSLTRQLATPSASDDS